MARGFIVGLRRRSQEVVRVELFQRFAAAVLKHAFSGARFGREKHGKIGAA